MVGGAIWLAITFVWVSVILDGYTREGGMGVVETSLTGYQVIYLLSWYAA